LQDHWLREVIFSIFEAVIRIYYPDYNFNSDKLARISRVSLLYFRECIECIRLHFGLPSYSMIENILPENSIYLLIPDFNFCDISPG
jgi:hypothetical protein